MLSLLLTAMLSILLTGYLGYIGAKQGLDKAVLNQLTGLRNVQAVRLYNDFQQSKSYALTLSETQMVINAIKGFKAGMEELNDKKLTPAQQEKLFDYYDKEFIPELAKRIDGEPKTETYMPFDPAEQYLQYHYMAANPNKTGEKIKLDYAKDGSNYSKVHQKYHYKFRNILDRMGYKDMFLIDNDAQVVYTAGKYPDFVTNVKTGPYASSNLLKAFSKSIASQDIYYVDLVDFENYRPNLEAPTAFITTPIYDGKKRIGVLVLELSNARLNRIMTYDGKWPQMGLGKTGETQLIGKDNLVRTNLRLFLEDKDAYFKTLEKANFDPDQINRIRTLDTPILTQKINTEAVRRALEGEKGETYWKDYRGIDVLGAYQPVNFTDFRWALIAKLDQEEAFASINNLTRNLLITAAILIPFFTLLSLYLARLLTNPINRLINSIKKITSGEKDVEVDVNSKDEIGKLASTFNLMARSLKEKEQLIEEKDKANKDLLLNILPEPIAERVERGEEDIADNFPNVTIIYAEIEGFNSFSDNIEADKTVAFLNELVGAFDEMAEQYGVEKLKTVGSAYIAVCGLTIPRVDHAKRTVDFAFALLKLIKTFNQKRGSNLGLDIGIHSGPVIAGVVGKTKFIYELWGETMNITKAIHESPETNIIQVTESVYSTLNGLYEFKYIGSILMKGKGDISVWSVHPLLSHTVANSDKSK